MKMVFPLLSLGVIIGFLGAGCSKDEQPSTPERGPRVVIPIIKPKPKQTDVTSTVQKKKDKPEPAKIAETKSGLENKKKPSALRSDTTKQTGVTKKSSGSYLASKGESLTSISARQDVYGDPMNWPILYRFNLDKLEELPLEADLPEKEIPDKIELKFITPEEARENHKRRADRIWVVNILSTSDKKEAATRTIEIIRNGYPAYITTAKVKGKDWMRLRVGFFSTKAEAEAVGKRIMALSDLAEFWSTRADGPEIEKFAGYSDG